MRTRLLAPALLCTTTLLAACQQDETIRAYGAGDGVWQLAELRGTPFSATATIGFTDEGVIGGIGPCNSYSARMDTPYPWWGTGPIRATRRACPDLAAETAFFAALEAAKIAKVRDGRMVLAAEDGTELLAFTPAE